MKYTKVYDVVDCAPLGYEDTTAKVWVNLTANAKDRYFQAFRGMFDDTATPAEKEQAEHDYEDSIAEFVKEIRSGDEIIAIESRDDLYQLRGDNDAGLIAYIVEGMFALHARRVEKAKATFRERIS